MNHNHNLETNRQRLLDSVAVENSSASIVIVDNLFLIIQLSMHAWQEHESKEIQPVWIQLDTIFISDVSSDMGIIVSFPIIETLPQKRNEDAGPYHRYEIGLPPTETKDRH